MKRFLFVASLVLSFVALAKFTPFGGMLTSTSGAQVTALTPAVAGPGGSVAGWVGLRCDAPANAQTGTGYSDGGAAFTVTGADPYIYPNVPERLLQMAPGENAVAVAGSDGGTAHCWSSWMKEI